MGRHKNLKDLVDELENSTSDEAYYNFDMIRHNSMRKIMRKNFDLFRNSHIYYTDLQSMKDVVRAILYDLVATTDLNKLKDRSVRDPKNPGFHTFTDNLDCTIPFLVYDRNGRSAYMEIMNNSRVKILDTPLSICDSDFSIPRSFNLILYIRKGKEGDLSLNAQFDALAIGSSGCSVGGYNRKVLQKNSGRKDYYSIKIPFIEFIRIYMKDVLQNVSWLSGLSEVSTKAYLIRTLWQPKDNGRKPKNEQSLDVFHRTIRQVDNVLNYSAFAEITTDVRSPENPKQTIAKTICRIQLT